MDEETKNIIQTQRRKTLGCVLAVLSFTSAFLWSDLSRGSGFHGGGFHGGGFHGGFSTFHGGGFHPGFPRFHGGEFHPAFREFHGGGFHDGHFGEFHRFSEFHRFHHHGFRRGFVVAPAFGGCGGVADGVGPIIIIQTARITGTDLMQVTGIIAPIRRATTLM